MAMLPRFESGATLFYTLSGRQCLAIAVISCTPCIPALTQGRATAPHTRPSCFATGKRSRCTVHNNRYAYFIACKMPGPSITGQRPVRPLNMMLRLN